MSETVDALNRNGLASANSKAVRTVRRLSWILC